VATFNKCDPAPKWLQFWVQSFISKEEERLMGVDVSKTVHYRDQHGVFDSSDVEGFHETLEAERESSPIPQNVAESSSSTLGKRGRGEVDARTLMATPKAKGG
jgi:hypothetical protein